MYANNMQPDFFSFGMGEWVGKQLNEHGVHLEYIPEFSDGP